MALGTAVILATGVAVWLASFALSVVSYFHPFSYPPDPATPAFASVLATDDGSDSDDPMRAVTQVIDVGDATFADLAAFYRGAYPTGEGWQEQPQKPSDELCLIKRGDDFDEVLDVWPFTGKRRVGGGESRFLVTLARFNAGDGRCRLAAAWLPSDLL